MGSFSLAAAAINQVYPWFWPLVAAILGGVFGSFLNCARYRIPRGQSLRHPPSRCPSCKTVLGIVDLIPVVSWLGLRGRCRHCRATIPVSSLLIEGVCAGLAAFATAYFLGNF